MKIVDPSWNKYYKISGLSLLTGAIFFSIGLTLTVYKVLPLSHTAERLVILAKHQTFFQLNNVSFIMADIFYILGILGIYLSLYTFNKNHALVGTALGVLGAALAAGVRFGVYAETAIAKLYYFTPDESLQYSYFAATELIRNFNDIGLFIANLLIGVGGLIIGRAMLAGVFHKKLAYLFIVTNILYIIGFIGAIATSVFLPVILLACLLAITSMIFMGVRLYQVGKEVIQT